MIALLLDLANILGGFILAIPLLEQIPQIGDDLARFDRVLAPFAWVVGVVALVAGGYYFIDHAVNGPHIFHFEVVGILVGVALLWSRLTGRSSVTPEPGVGVDSRLGVGTRTGIGTRGTRNLEGTALLLAIFGVIAIIVGIEGLFTPN